MKKLSHERKCELRRLYDSFEVKDMSFADFLKAHERLMDPKTMQEDFAKICRQRAATGQINSALGINSNRVILP